MSGRNVYHKITAMMLSAIMVVGMMPESALADTGALSDGVSGEIIAFEPLESDIAEQSVPVGTSKAHLELPDTLAATILLAAEEEPALDSGEREGSSDSADTVSGSVIGVEETGDGESDADAITSEEPESGSNTGGKIASPSDAEESSDSSEAAPAEETGDGSTESTVSLSVTWVSTPEYDGEMAGKYIFTPEIPESYTLADGVVLPQITVTIGFAMRLALTTTSADYSWYDGDSSATEFEIGSAAQLKGLADIVNGSHGAASNFSGKKISLTSDINLSEIENWTPIGNGSYAFSGTFEGSGHTISNLIVNTPDASNVGLFGLVTGSVLNLILTDVSIAGKESVGGITGEAWGSLQNCAVIGGTVSGFSQTGGVVGKAFHDSRYPYKGSRIESCFSTCNISGVGNSPTYAGGIVGSAEYSNITNCYATGSLRDPEVTSQLSDQFYGVGGVAGWAKSSSIMNCYATGDVEGAQGVGGIVGVLNSYADRASELNGCVALNGVVSGYMPYGDGPQTGRIAGRFSGNQSDNYAYSGMTGTSGGALNGTDFTKEQIQSQDIFASLGFTSPAWSGGSGKVPILTGLQEKLQSSGIPWHIIADTPSLPQNLTAAYGDGKVTLSWAAPANPGTSSIIRYEVRKDSGAWISAGMSTSYTFTGLTNGTTYTFTVRAVNSSGDGAEKTIEQSPGKAPDIVTNTTVVKNGKQITVFWDPPAGTMESDGTYYETRYADNTDSLKKMDPAWNSVAYGECFQSYTISYWDTYVVQIRAVNRYGTGLTVTVQGVSYVPSSPQGFTAVQGDGQVALSWSAPSSAGDGYTLTGYEVFQPVSRTWLSVNASTTSLTVTGLANGQEYRFFVRATNASHDYGKGESATLTMTPLKPPSITSDGRLSLPYGTDGSFQVQTTGTAPLSYTLVGAPTGVTIDNDGLISVSKTLSVGSYSFTIRVSNGSESHATQNFTLTVSRYTPVSSDLQFDALTDCAYTGAGIGIGSVTDKRSIGLSVTVSYEGTGETIYAKSTVPPRNTGNYKVTAAIAGNSNINATSFTLGTYSILPKAITITPAKEQSKKFGQPDPVLQYTLYPSLAVGDSLTGSLARNPGNSVGSYAITQGTLSGGGNYTLSLSGTTVYFTITPNNDVSFSIGDISPQTYTGSALTPEPTVQDGAQTLEKSTDYTYSYTDNTNAGTATVYITGIGNYAGSTGSKTFTIGKANNTLSISCGNIAYGETPLPRVETNTGSGAVSYEYKLQGAEDDTYSPAVPANAGNYTVRGTSVETANYLSATDTEKFEIAKVNNTLNISCDDSTYGEAFLPVVETNISGGTVIYQYKVQGADDSAYTSDVPTDAGYYMVRGTSEPTINYNSAKATANFSIVKANNTLHISCANITYGQMFSPTVDINTGGGAVTWEYKVQGAQDSTYTSSVPTDAGDYTVRGTSAATQNYYAGTATANFTIGKATPSPTLESSPSSTQSRPGSVTLTATLPADATGTLTFKAGTNTVTTVTLPSNTAAFTPSSAENAYSFTVEYSGDSNYESKTSTALEYSFTKSEQDNVIASNGSVNYGKTLDLSTLVDDSSGCGTGAFTFSKIDGPGEINNTTLTPTGAGDVNISVTKAADDDYNAKSTIFKVTVSPRVITFTVAAVGTQVYTGSPVTPTPIIKDGDTVLTEGVHFTYFYSRNTDAGATATINVIGIGGYAGSNGSTTFNIVRRSSDSGSSESRNTVIVPAIRPNQPTAASVNATAQVKGKNATLTITDSMVKATIDKALENAKAKENTANGISLNISVTATGAAGFELTLERTALNRLLETGVTSFSVSSLPVNMSFDKAALKQFQTQCDSNLVITVKPAIVTGLRSAFNVTLSYTKDGKAVNVTSLETGTSTLSISAEPGINEFGSYLYGAYVGTNNQINRIADSAYDANSRRMIFSTNHFSVYGVGYTAPSAKLTDIGSHWAKGSIDYVVGRGLLSGTTETTFAPDTAMTRGMLVTALGRLANVDTKAYSTNSFTDVKVGSAFRPYIEWAYQKGIVQDFGNQKFAPDLAVTREQIAVILADFAKATGYTLPVTRTAATYADASSISSIYKTAVTAMQQAGIIMGDTGNKFNPKSSVTRAEISSMLHRYIKLTIDPATAQGWVKNDAGQYLYFKDGKALTGAQTVDSTKYFFETTGVLKTGWVKDGDNWRYYSGNTMLVGFWGIANGSNKTYYFDTYGNMVSGKWLQIDGKWYYFYADGSLARNAKIGGYEIDENGVRKTK